MRLRPPRGRRRGRIEIIPMIDVMFFLLATFMLASLTLQNLHSLPVNLPRGETENLSAPHFPVLTVTRDGHLSIDGEPATPEELSTRLRSRLGDGARTVIVNADVLAPNGIVVQAMLAGRSGGAEKFLFAIRRK